jgi:hypothetical protein
MEVYNEYRTITRKIMQGANPCPHAFTINLEDEMIQKYLPGQRVKISDKMPPMMSHFDKGMDAIVLYTYAQACSGKDFKSYSIAPINKNGNVYSMISWYPEKLLTFVNDNYRENWELVEKYINKR